MGAFFLDTLQRLHPDLVFFSAKGYTPDAGFTDPHLPEVGSKQALIRSGSSVVALVDHSKFGRRALATIATHADVNTIITDAEPDDDICSALDTDDIQLILAP